MTKLDKFCLFTPFKAFGISFFISLVILLILSLIVSVDNLTEKEVRNRYGEGDFSHLIVYSLLILCCIFCSLCSYIIFLNRYKKIRDNDFLSFLTFISPVILISLITLIAQGISENIGSRLLMSLGAAVLSIPFIIPQMYYFVKFRKRLKSGEILEDFYEEVYESN